VKGCVAGQVRITNHLVLTINVISDVPARLPRFAPEIAEVDRFAFFPEKA
jgi:hypothetical protein